MNAFKLIDSLERFGELFPALVKNVSSADARWKPADGAWSILEIVSHLADEEVDDLRARSRLILDDPAKDWPPIEPSRWAVERKYNEGDLGAVVARFVRERAASVAWLRSLKDPDWSTTKQHPKFALLRAGDLLTSWAAHDALHLRQIAKRMYQLSLRDGEGYSGGYAGEWTS